MFRVSLTSVDLQKRKNSSEWWGANQCAPHLRHWRHSGRQVGADACSHPGWEAVGTTPVRRLQSQGRWSRAAWSAEPPQHECIVNRILLWVPYKACMYGRTLTINSDGLWRCLFVRSVTTSMFRPLSSPPWSTVLVACLRREPWGFMVRKTSR